MLIKPNKDFEKCDGFNPETNHVCGYRERCFRYTRPSSGKDQEIREFWRNENDDCSKYVSIPRP